ncbi:MAG: hypothetical protein AAGG80_00970 [Pseudomonadota bacterium]
MSKEKSKRREEKKNPLMFAKEKKVAKRIKKSGKPSALQIKTEGL